jgi:hypothetical protein
MASPRACGATPFLRKGVSGEWVAQLDLPLRYEGGLRGMVLGLRCSPPFGTKGGATTADWIGRERR